MKNKMKQFGILLLLPCFVTLLLFQTQAYAEEKQIPIVGEIPRSDEIIRWEDQGKTVIEGDADSEISKSFFELAEKLLEDETERVR